MNHKNKMLLPLPAALESPTNRPVLAHLADQSAHSDIASVLADAVQPLGDVQLFCPDSARYRYVVASTRNVIFGFASGMDVLAFRLDEKLLARALVTGGVAQRECGPGWVRFVLFRNDWPKVDAEFWARKAYVHARESAG